MPIKMIHMMSRIFNRTGYTELTLSNERFA